jgi:hypothetical protein
LSQRGRGAFGAGASRAAQRLLRQQEAHLAAATLRLDVGLEEGTCDAAERDLAVEVAHDARDRVAGHGLTARPALVQRHRGLEEAHRERGAERLRREEDRQQGEVGGRHRRILLRAALAR